MMITRIHIPESIEYDLTKDLVDVMFKRSVRNALTGIETGMRFTDYHANPIMVA